MHNGPVYLTSDAHLGAVAPDRERAFLNWLEYAASEASEIVINGDLFDFWFEYRHAIPRGHTRVLGLLTSIVDSGIPIRLVGGNHDWWGGSYLEDEVGVTFQRDPETLELAGHRTFLAHGDGLGAGDLGYRMLKAVLRGRLSQWGFRWIHPDLGAWIARRVSSTPQDGHSNHRDNSARSDALEAWARAHLKAEPSVDIVALGHTHAPRLVEVEAGRWYINSGDWIEHDSYVVLRPGAAPELKSWRDR